jgi:hypothetical protein
MEDELMSFHLSEILGTGKVPVVVNTDRITDIRDCYLTGQHYVDVQLAEDHILTDYATPYICAQAIYSGIIPTGHV